MDHTPTVQKILTTPTPAALWQLYGQLLAAGVPPEAPLLGVVGAFHHYLADLRSKASARQFSELASVLDIGAVGGIALQNLIGSEGGRAEASHLLHRLLLGTISESLMVVASRQYVKGWSSELNSVHCQAAWFLAGTLWTLSAEMQPELPASERWTNIQELIAPALDPDTANVSKAVLLGRLFQILLLGHLLPFLPFEPESGRPTAG